MVYLVIFLLQAKVLFCREIYKRFKWFSLLEKGKAGKVENPVKDRQSPQKGPLQYVTRWLNTETSCCLANSQESSLNKHMKTYENIQKCKHHWQYILYFPPKKYLLQTTQSLCR